MRELALHILDIAENSVAAGAKTVEICVDEDQAGNRIRIVIQDDGKGMDPETLSKVVDPFVTSRTTRAAGLGIPFLKAAAEACNGSLRLSSEPGRGTCLEADFERDHIDRMPLGDLAGTVLALVVGFPETHWVFHYQVDGERFTFDDGPLKRELGELSLSEPPVLRFIREILQVGVADIRSAALSPRISAPGG